VADMDLFYEVGGAISDYCDFVTEEWLDRYRYINSIG
jgi:hypothetical protein